MSGMRTTLETNELSENLSHKVQISSNEETVYLVIRYMEDRFLVEKMFRNNFFGLEDLRKMQEKLDTEEKMIQYLGLGDEKNGK